MTTSTGLLKSARYSYQPNFLGYCGGQDPQYLFDCVVEGHTDLGLFEKLLKFGGALPYFELIARDNGIADPFDLRVVEAYWIGNALLGGVDLRGYYDGLVERFRGKVSPETLRHIVGKVPVGALPHHSFHVLDVCTRTGSLADSLDVLDRCRISWGTVEQVVGNDVLVQSASLKFESGKIVLSAPRAQTWQWAKEGRGFVSALQVGEMISSHWGWVCDRLTADEAKRLEKYTRHHVGVANGIG